MKILYLSCHSILEYDELKLFEELNYDFFSLGSYVDPLNPVDSIRPALKKPADPDLLAIAPDRNDIPREFFNKFDVIIVMHIPEWIERNWHNMKHKRVIWRTIGQSTTKIERRLKPYKDDGLEVVRYSPREQYIEGNIGIDNLIRFYKDDMEFGEYNGMNNKIITFSQNMKHRGEHCSFEPFMQITEPFREKTTVYGPNNENLGDLNGGFLTYDQMRQTYRDNRVYFYTGTQPASYTLNFMEAFMTGIPIVALGAKYANSLKIAGDTYEVPDFIKNGINGFCSDNVEELQAFIKKLMDNHNYAKKVGFNGRQTAIELFGKEKIKSQWKEYLEK